MRYKTSLKRKKWRNNQIEAKKRAISARSAPDYPEVINHKEYWDDIKITRHTPYGIEELAFTLFMSPKRVDSCFVMQGRCLVMGENKRPRQMGMYRALNYIANILGRKGGLNEHLQTSTLSILQLQKAR